MNRRAAFRAIVAAGLVALFFANLVGTIVALIIGNAEAATRFSAGAAVAGALAIGATFLESRS